MTPEKEIELCENVATIIAKLGALSEKMDNFNSILDAHTDNDTVNFLKIETDLQVIKLDKAKEEGIAEEAARHSRAVGSTWGAVSGGVVSIIAAIITAFLGTK